MSDEKNGQRQPTPPKIVRVQQPTPAERAYLEATERKVGEVLRVLASLEWQHALHVLGLAVRQMIVQHVPRGAKGAAFKLHVEQLQKGLSR